MLRVLGGPNRKDMSTARLDAAERELHQVHLETIPWPGTGVSAKLLIVQMKDLSHVFGATSNGAGQIAGRFFPKLCAQGRLSGRSTVCKEKPTLEMFRTAVMTAQLPCQMSLQLRERALDEACAQRSLRNVFLLL